MKLRVPAWDGRVLRREIKTVSGLRRRRGDTASIVSTRDSATADNHVRIRIDGVRRDARLTTD